MLELPNFGHMTTSIIENNIIWATSKNFVGDVMFKNNYGITFISKFLYFKKS